MRIAVIQFPGVNCEYESAATCEAAGMKAEIIRWNSKVDLERFDGFFLPGGWSYDDRVRGGAIAAKDPLMERLKEQAKKGKPIIGVCNGAQILVESGFVPNLKGKFSIDFGLAPNINPFISGYYCTWVNLVHSTVKQTAFNSKFKHNEVIRVPIAHGEGRFVTSDPKVVEELEKNGQIVFKYSTAEGDVINEFPINPNGSIANIAAICNPEGNVLAIMPHPERSLYNHHMPGFNGDYKQAKIPGPGMTFFTSMKEYIEGRK